MKHHKIKIENVNFINKLKGASKNKIISNIKSATEGDIRTICQCALNILKGTINLCPRTINKLKKHKNSIKNIALKKTSIKSKRKYLVQQGGFLPLLASIVAPILFDLIK